MAETRIDCNECVFIILCEASERPAVRCSDWLDVLVVFALHGRGARKQIERAENGKIND